MGRIALELNDAGLLASSEPGVVDEALVPSPGIATTFEGRLLVGEPAARRWRLAPLAAHNRYWLELDTAAPGLPPAPPMTAADLAHAQLVELLDGAGADGVLAAVPPGWTRDQLGLLAGIVGETGNPLHGLVDAGLVACATVPAARRMLHLDLQLHQAVLTVVEHSNAEGVLRRSAYELLPDAGAVAVQQALAASVAAAFVRETRYDPLHHAAGEQSLYDRLAGWLAAATADGEVAAELESGPTTHRATLRRAAFTDAAARCVSDLVRLVQSGRPAGQPVRLCVSARAAAVPGLVERLAELRDCDVVLLGRGAVVRGVLALADAIARPPESLVLVHRLPSPPLSEPSVEPASTVPAAERPTHVLLDGVAHPLDARPLLLGSAPSAGRSLALPAGIPGLSRLHCTLRLESGAVLVEDRSTYGTFVNGERVAGRAELRVGDQLRLGAPGVTLALIRVVVDDGPPQV